MSEEQRTDELIWRGTDALREQLAPIGDVREDPSNVRKHNAKNLDAIKASLTRFGQQKPIVCDRDGIVRAGNGTLRAARELGWSHVALVRSQLEGSELTAYAIADNRTAELAEWDEALPDVIRALRDEGARVDDLGWDESELTSMWSESTGSAHATAWATKHELVIECESESQQRELYEKLTAQGLSCRVLTL